MNVELAVVSGCLLCWQGGREKDDSKRRNGITARLGNNRDCIINFWIDLAVTQTMAASWECRI